MTEQREYEPIIETQELSKSFNGLEAVKDLTVRIPPGIIFGLIGPSGCGKTTTVRLLTGIYEPDSGSVEVLRTPPRNFGRRERSQLGYMPQQFVLYPELNVLENLNFAASLYGQPIRRKKRLAEVLDLVELTGHKKKKAHDLSGGMQRRLALGAAVIHDPRLLFLDEPTAAIDPVLRRKFWDYFRMIREQGRTVIVTTQYVGEAAHCDYVGVMLSGHLLMVETPVALRRRAMGGDLIHLHTDKIMSDEQLRALRRQPFVVDQRTTRLPQRGVQVVVQDASTALPQLLEWCKVEQIGVESVSESVPMFDDVFVKLIEHENTVWEKVYD